MSAARKLATVSDVPQSESEGNWILSRGWDIFFIGGASIGIFLMISVLFRQAIPDAQVAMFVFNLSFLINFPHFLVSYQLLYGDHRNRIRREFRFAWAAIIVPLVLGGGMAMAYAFGSTMALGHFLNAMYFFVGWHYVKQTFGVVVVSNVMHKVFYNSVERFWLKFNMYALWGVSFVAMNVGIRSYAQMGVPYTSLNFPGWLLYVAYGALSVSALGVIVTHLQKYIREGRWPSISAVIAYSTIYLWLLPVVTHPMYMHMTPAFHSLQYLLFVYAFRRNKVDSQIKHPNTPEGRRYKLQNLWGYLLGAVILGANSFYIIPTLLDLGGVLSTVVAGPTPAIFFATIFINIHHYFIDNVIWRGQNPEIREHLFRSAS